MKHRTRRPRRKPEPSAALLKALADWLNEARQQAGLAGKALMLAALTEPGHDLVAILTLRKGFITLAASAEGRAPVEILTVRVTPLEPAGPELTLNRLH